MNKPIDLTKEGLLDFFNRGYAGFAGKDGDYTDVLIDGTYDLEELANAIMNARLQEREECAKVAEIERRTDLALKHGYKPTWFVVQEEIAKAIRARK